MGKEDYWICSSIVQVYCRALCDLSVGHCNITVIRRKKKKNYFHILLLIGKEIVCCILNEINDFFFLFLH